MSDRTGDDKGPVIGEWVAAYHFDVFGYVRKDAIAEVRQKDDTNDVLIRARGTNSYQRVIFHSRDEADKFVHFIVGLSK